jgi:hypothetical protein
MNDPRELRSLVYELARARLGKEIGQGDTPSPRRRKAIFWLAQKITLLQFNFTGLSGLSRQTTYIQRGAER